MSVQIIWKFFPIYLFENMCIFSILFWEKLNVGGVKLIRSMAIKHKNISESTIN